MVVSRRTRKKPVLTRARTGETPDEAGSYTVETREREAPPQEPGPGDSMAGILEALRGAGQIGIYRQQPQWARGHLQTLNLTGGESIDFQMLDELQRYWGGGVYSFRPMNKGQFAGSSRSFQFDGPTLYQGKPHPKDPSIQAPVTPEVMPPQAHYMGIGGYPPPPYAAGYDAQQPGMMARASPELQMLGGFMERMMTRLDGLEAKLAGPGAAPAQAPNQIDGVLQTLKLAQKIGEMWNPRGDDEDYELEPEAPKNPQEAVIQALLKKFDEDPEALDKLIGNKGAAQPNQQQPQAGGPRLVRAAEQQAQPAAAAPAGGMSPAQILAHLQQLDPAARAELVNQIGQSLDPETLEKLAQVMAPGSAAG